MAGFLRLLDAYNPWAPSAEPWTPNRALDLASRKAVPTNMQNMNNALRLGTFISQLEAGRSEQVAAMVVEATLPYGHLDDDWPGRGGREVGKLSRALAKAANPKRGLSEAQLLELLQDTFAQYTAIAGAATVQPEASVAFRSWRTYLAWACDPTLNVKELLAGEGLQLQS